MPFVDLSELKDRANAARSSLSTRMDGVKTSAQTAYRKHNSAGSGSPSGEKPNFADPAEKQALFNLLDTYFTRRGHRNLNHTSHVPQAPPAVKSTTRPSTVAVARAPPRALLVESSPQPSASGSDDSEAYKLSQFFLPSTSWSSYPEWFAFDRLPQGSQPTPPPLANRDVIRSSSWSYRGTQKTLDGIALFEDLSISWYHLTWTDPRTVKREARWSSPPTPWNGADLYAASMMYGDLLAEFAEAAERSRQWIGRGECWDLANEGLKSVGERIEQSGGPKPMPCIGRTHGHLLFTAVARKPGTWRGGENAIRRGDIVQWLSAKVKPVGQPHVTMTLGEPDHTAIVVTDTAVAGLENGGESEDGLQALDAACIGSLEVVEQSVREIPTRRTYDMSQFLSGQVSDGNCTRLVRGCVTN